MIDFTTIPGTPFMHSAYIWRTRADPFSNPVNRLEYGIVSPDPETIGQVLGQAVDGVMQLFFVNSEGRV